MQQIVIIPQYLREIKLSEARMKKYYELGKREPKAIKYQDKSKYDWAVVKPYPKSRKFLIDIETGERVIANPKAQGTPKIITINGQKIYNGEVNKNVRNKVMMEIKKSFKPYIEKMEPISNYPIKITLEIHDTIRESQSNNLWDIDNRSYPYIKGFQDCLTGNCDKLGNLRNKKIIEDDSVLFIIQAPVPVFIPVDDPADRKLVFILSDDVDKRILQHLGFVNELQKYFKQANNDLKF
jgi:hypothetical protein